MPHSVIRETISGRLIDITPDPTNSSIPFVEHLGSEEDFAILGVGPWRLAVSVARLAICWESKQSIGGSNFRGAWLYEKGQLFVVPQASIFFERVLAERMDFRA